jgi:hypothetical protein
MFFRIKIKKNMSKIVKKTKEIRKAIANVKLISDMNNYGDALAFQKEIRKDKFLPFRE